MCPARFGAALASFVLGRGAGAQQGAGTPLRAGIPQYMALTDFDGSCFSWSAKNMDSQAAARRDKIWTKFGHNLDMLLTVCSLYRKSHTVKILQNFVKGSYFFLTAAAALCRRGGRRQKVVKNLQNMDSCITGAIPALTSARRSSQLLRRAILCRIGGGDSPFRSSYSPPGAV